MITLITGRQRVKIMKISQYHPVLKEDKRKVSLVHIYSQLHEDVRSVEV
jgi:hypothetical protein